MRCGQQTVTAEMLAAVVGGPGALQVDSVPRPQANGRALVAVRYVGICGTDLKIIDGSIPVAYPRVLGHEMVGEVVVPAADGRLPAGALVLLDPSVACGTCVRCRRGDLHLCGNGGLMGRDLDGVFAEQVAVDERQLFPLSDDQAAETGPLLQILGTCVHGQRLLRAEPGDTAVVVGLGVSGLLHLQLLRARGVERVIGVSRSPRKLRSAERLGATAVAVPEDAEGLVTELTAGEGADLVVESSGALAGLATAIAVARHGADVLMYGTISAVAGQLPFYTLYAKELALIGSRAALPGDYAAAIELVEAGRVQLAPLLSATLPLAQISAAVARFRDGTDLKVTLAVPG